MGWARQLLPHVREVAGGIPVTVSVDAPASNLVDLQLALGSAAPDFWDFHYYFLPGSAQATFREVAAIAAPRPLLIGEVGYSTFPGNPAIPGVPTTAPAREAYQDYVLTEKGRDLQPILLALIAWGDRYTAENGAPLEIVHEDHAFHMVPTCSVCGEPIDTHNVHSRPGPGANEEQRRLAVTRFPAGQAA